MIGLVMAGGKGTRMSLPGEKLLLKYKKPIIFQVIQALKDSGSVSKIICTTSPNSPITRNAIIESNLEYFETSGRGYVEDLNFALQKFKETALVVSGDLPLLDGDIIKKIVSMHDKNTVWLSILVTKDFLESMGLSPKFYTKFQNKECCYTGISIVESDKITDLNQVEEKYKILDDKRVAFNLNTKNDYDLLGAT